MKAAYKHVRHARDMKRKRLVCDVVAASRDEVIQKMSRRQNEAEAKCDDTRSSDQCHYREKKRRRTIFDQLELAERPKKRSGITAILASPTQVASLESTKNGRMGWKHNYGSTCVESSTRTLVFPRLPSNNSPMHHIIFAPSMLKTRNSNGTTNDTLGITQPPNLTKEGKQNEYSVSIKPSGGGTGIVTTTHQPLLIEGAHAPRPKSSSMIFLKSTIAADDEPTLNHVPYLGDGVNEDIFSELYDTKKRERLYEFGPPYQEKETLETIDEVLKLMAVQKPHLFEDVALFNQVVTSKGTTNDDNDCDASVEKEKAPITPGQLHVKILRRIHLLLAELTNVDLERVHERHSTCFVREVQSEDKRSRISPSTSSSSFSEDKTNINNHSKVVGPTVSSHKENLDSRETMIPYSTLMDSYRSLFCRRCFTYDCTVHGNVPQASLDLLGELAVQKELDGHWKEVRGNS